MSRVRRSPADLTSASRTCSADFEDRLSLCSTWRLDSLSKKKKKFNSFIFDLLQWVSFTAAGKLL